MRRGWKRLKGQKRRKGLKGLKEKKMKDKR
jgi:hypothetical protein